MMAAYHGHFCFVVSLELMDLDGCQTPGMGLELKKSLEWFGSWKLIAYAISAFPCTRFLLTQKDD
jgi:hypothetical protein